MMRRKKPKELLVTSLWLGLLWVGWPAFLGAQSSNWKVPASADKLTNPYKGDASAIAAGKKLYDMYCAVCHGKKGRGDGPAGMALKPRPANLASAAVQRQSDGALFWKITNGNPPMAAYKHTLTEAQRWQVVTFLRTLAN